MSFLRSRENRIKLAGFAVLAVVSAYLVHQWKFRDGARSETDGRVLTEAERVEIQRALDLGRERAQAANAGWRAAIDVLTSKTIIGDRDTGDCPIRVPLHPANDKKPPLWLNRVKEENLSREKSAWGKFYDEQSKEITKAIAMPQTSEKIASLLGDALRTKMLDMEWEVTFVLDVDNEPRLSYAEGPMGKEYTPGMVGGHAYVYDYRSKKIECAAHIVAENAPVIKYEYKKAPDGPMAQLEQGRLEAEAKLRLDLLEMMYLKLSNEIRYRAKTQ